jgi:hypothetical protein
MSRHAQRRIASAARFAVVVAFVHQLGACGCGCLDHNWWYQSAVALLADGTPSVAMGEVPVVESSDCEDGLGGDCLTPGRLGLRDSLTERVVAAPLVSFVVTEVAEATPSAPLLPSTPGPCAPAARATVWRL